MLLINQFVSFTILNNLKNFKLIKKKKLKTLEAIFYYIICIFSLNRKKAKFLPGFLFSLFFIIKKNSFIIYFFFFYSPKIRFLLFFHYPSLAYFYAFINTNNWLPENIIIFEVFNIEYSHSLLSQIIREYGGEKYHQLSFFFGALNQSLFYYAKFYFCLKQLNRNIETKTECSLLFFFSSSYNRLPLAHKKIIIYFDVSHLASFYNYSLINIVK